ncbi:MAG: PorV/PorQ family protein [Bacteroidetes bacterium]|nr:PorV/PorQ family protein [Bacteroidota bacterium]
MKNIKSLLPVLALFLSNMLSAQAPKYSNEFLAIGVGGRALGLSNSCIASVNDVTSGYWNPAGLLGVKNDMQVGLMHSEYFAGIAKYDYGAVARRLDSSSAFGLSMIRFGVDNIPNTTELIDASGNVDYDKITQFSAVDYGFIISYARTPKIKGLRLGANAKIIRRIVGDFAGAWGFGLDAGAQYEYKGWKLGAMARDITSTFNAWSYNLTQEMKDVFAYTNNEIPTNSIEVTLPRLILGGARKFDLMKDLSMLAELNVDMTFDGMRNVLIKSNPISADPHFGLELGYKGIAFLRGGILNIQHEQDVTGKNITTLQPNFGVGIKIKRISIDYAKTDIGNQSVALYSHVFSVRLDINKQSK